MFGFPKGERRFFDAWVRRAFEHRRVMLHMLLNLFQGFRSKEFAEIDTISRQIKSEDT
jgi:hypothetical protein